MKVYTLQFDYFEGSAWQEVAATLIAPSKIALIRCFIEETTHAVDSLNEAISDKEYRKLLWNKNKKNIKHEDFSKGFHFSELLSY